MLVDDKAKIPRRPTLRGADVATAPPRRRPGNFLRVSPANEPASLATRLTLAVSPLVSYRDGS